MGDAAPHDRQLAAGYHALQLAQQGSPREERVRLGAGPCWEAGGQHPPCAPGCTGACLYSAALGAAAAGRRRMRMQAAALGVRTPAGQAGGRPAAAAARLDPTARVSASAPSLPARPSAAPAASIWAGARCKRALAPAWSFTPASSRALWLAQAWANNQRQAGEGAPACMTATLHPCNCWHA